MTWTGPRCPHCDRATERILTYLRMNVIAADYQEM